MNQIFTRNFKTSGDLCVSMSVMEGKETVIIGLRNDTWKYYCKKKLYWEDNLFPIIAERPLGSLLLDFGENYTKHEKGDGDALEDAIIALECLLVRYASKILEDRDDSKIEQDAAEILRRVFDGNSMVHKYAAIFIWNLYLSARRHLEACRKEILGDERKKQQYREGNFKKRMDMVDKLYQVRFFLERTERLIKPMAGNKAILSEGSCSLIQNPEHSHEVELSIDRSTDQEDVQYVITVYSFVPLLRYYFDKLKDWKLKFQPECIVCHKPFLTDNLKRKVCSEGCMKVQQKKHNEDYQKREKEDNRKYTKQEKNLRQLIYRLQKEEELSPDRKQILERKIKEVYQELKKKKALVKGKEMPEDELTAWMWEQDKALRRIVYPND